MSRISGNFGVYTSTPKVELCMCSFRDKIYLGFTSRYDCDAIKENFFQILREQEVKTEILKVEYPESVMTEAKGMQIFKIFTFLCMIAIVTALGVDYSMIRIFICRCSCVAVPLVCGWRLRWGSSSGIIC